MLRNVVKNYRFASGCSSVRRAQHEFESTMTGDILGDLGAKFKVFNKSVGFQPNVEPVDRSRELKFIVESSFDNWCGPLTNKYNAIFAPQSQGSGKTFLGQHLNAFITKDMKSSKSVVNQLLNNPRYSHLASHVAAFSTTRSIVIPVDQLSTKCESFEEAVVVEVISQLCGKNHPNWEVLQKVRARNLDFPQLCDELLDRNGALIIVLDGVMDLASERSAHLAWQRSVERHTDTREQRTRAAMTLLKDLLQSVLGRPGVVLYITGRAPEQTYKLMTVLKSAPLLAQAVFFDAMQHSHIVEMLTLTRFSESKVKMSEAIGLRNDQEVSELAWWALFNTGGVPRVLAGALTELMSGRYLGPQHRTPEQSVWDVLSSKTVSNGLYKTVMDCVPQDILPNWSHFDTIDVWNKDFVKASLFQVLDATRDGVAVKCSMKVEVAPGKRVDAMDLLSVLGVPFRRRDGGHSSMTVHLGAWSIRAMLEEGTVRWTLEDVQRQMKWMEEITACNTLQSVNTDDSQKPISSVGISTTEMLTKCTALKELTLLDFAQENRPDVKVRLSIY